MAPSLVIAIGNPLRSDDGLAWRAADELSRSQPKDIDIVTVHQVTPEIAETVSRSPRVVFIDASAEMSPGQIRCEELNRGTAMSAEMSYSHQISPAALLLMALSLYRADPTAFLVTCGGQCFEHGDSLTSEVSKAIPELVAKVKELLIAK